MPAIPKSVPTKKGVPKAKGAVRAKSGCYTCRIRRKKCDEQSDDSGRCQTCVRLRLECLGFGAKRPEWLRESRNVTELREKIKGFLAAQGMIKGHSGSGPRSSEREPPTLRLAEDYSDSSESPPTPTLSLSNDPIRHPHNTSAIRDEGSVWVYNQPSPYSYPSPGSIHDPSSYQLPNVDPATSLVPSPAIRSVFSPLYHYEFSPEEYFYPEISVEFSRNPTPFIPTECIDEMVNHYMRNVVDIQYLLADKAVPGIIFQTVSSHERARAAVTLLASVHYRRFVQPEQHAFQTTEIRDRLESLNSLLHSATSTAEDAMAALHVVSSILFDGGRGSWHEWLKVACRYVDGLFTKSYDPADALLHCSAKDAFVIKTAIWFDVLASVTTQEEPHFLPVIREMFSPVRSTIFDTSTADTAAQYSMMSPMGCENTVVWALAETSALSCWKRNQLYRGCLSVPRLVTLAGDIDAYLSPSSDTDQPSSDFHGRRRLASDIFRSAARLYLRSVVSGNHPHVPEIRESVQDMVQCIQRIKQAPNTTVIGEQPAARTIVRNTVFGFFICGVFAETEHSKNTVLEQLDREGEGVGNCRTVRELLVKLWDTRMRSPREKPVEWRQMLKDAHILLV